jgi:hypothetical protein
LLVSFGFSALLSSCVVTSGDGIGGASNGGGTTGGSAGAATGGSATGGSAGTGTGGSAGQVSVACDPGLATPATCDTGNSDPCLACLATNCCTEYAACFGTNPNDRCSKGGPTGAGEFQCLRDCVASPSTYGCTDAAFSPEAQACCGSGPCNTAGCPGVTTGDTTNALMTCINDEPNNFPCAAECGF